MVCPRSIAIWVDHYRVVSHVLNSVKDLALEAIILASMLTVSLSAGFTLLSIGPVSARTRRIAQKEFVSLPTYPKSCVRCTLQRDRVFRPRGLPSHLSLPGLLSTWDRFQGADFSEEIQSLSSPTRWNKNTPVSAASSLFSGEGMNRLAGGGTSPVNSLSDMFGTEDNVQIRCVALLTRSFIPTVSLHHQWELNTPFSMDSSTVLASRAAAFAKQRSQSFIERSNRLNHHPAISSITLTCLNDWGLLDGKLDWSVQGDELQKLRNPLLSVSEPAAWNQDYPWKGLGSKNHVSRVELLVKESQETILAPVWMELSYMETEQIVA